MFLATVVYALDNGVIFADSQTIMVLDFLGVDNKTTVIDQVKFNATKTYSSSMALVKNENFIHGLEAAYSLIV